MCVRLVFFLAELMRQDGGEMNSYRQAFENLRQAFAEKLQASEKKL